MKQQQQQSELKKRKQLLKEPQLFKLNMKQQHPKLKHRYQQRKEQHVVLKQRLKLKSRQHPKLKNLHKEQHLKSLKQPLRQLEPFEQLAPPHLSQQKPQQCSNAITWSISIN
jgi:Na+-transporting NADH:ubiquinone oxidoreductase subunit NqrC